MLRLLYLTVFAVLTPALALAGDRQRIVDRTTFVRLVEGKRLTMPLVELAVTSGGAIRGRAFGRDVTGTWSWDNGYFCREMTAGREQVPLNCQQVDLEGNALRFTSDRGAGQSARLTLR